MSYEQYNTEVKILNISIALQLANGIAHIYSFDLVMIEESV